MRGDGFIARIDRKARIARIARIDRTAPVTRRRRGLAVAILASLATLAGALACGEPAPARATLSVTGTLADADTAGYARATEPRELRFPEDHGPHPAFKHEWWYFTGNLQTAGVSGSGVREFGFQLTFFRSALRPDTVTVKSQWATRQAYMGHFAVTDIQGEAFHAFERFDRGALGLAGAEGMPMRVWIGDWEAGSISGSISNSSRGRARSPGADGRAGGAESPGETLSAVGAETRGEHGFRIRAVEGGVALELILEQTQPPVLQGREGEEGLSRKGPEPGNASYYYSLMRLEAIGTLRVGGAEYAVTGSAWLDREWSTSALSPGLAGWDWFSLQLDDDSELMLYRLREDDGGTAPFSAGTFVAPDGTVSRLSADDFTLEETGAWTSPRGGRYPSGWRIRVPRLDLVLDVEPRLRDQELDLAFRYWEGAVGFRGRRAGRGVAGKGYVELTGY